MDLIVIGMGQFGKALAGVYEKHGFRVFKLEKDSPWPSKISPKPVTLLCVPTQSLPELRCSAPKSLRVAAPLFLQRKA